MPETTRNMTRSLSTHPRRGTYLGHATPFSQSHRGPAGMTENRASETRHCRTISAPRTPIIRSHPPQAGHVRIAHIPLVSVKTLFPNCCMPLPAKPSINGERRLPRIDNARKRQGAANNAQMKEKIPLAWQPGLFKSKSGFQIISFPPQKHAWPTKCLAHPITCLNMERRPAGGPCRLQRSAHMMV